MVQVELPLVQTTKMEMDAFDAEHIVQSLIRETGIPEYVAQDVTDRVVRTIIASNVQWLSGPLIREFCCVVFAQMGLHDARRKYTRIGMPLYDYKQLLMEGYKENSNQYKNPESIQAWAANRIAAEYSLLELIPEHLAHAHYNGDLHIHKLEYFNLRPFCGGWDLRMLYYCGLPPGGSEHTASSSPAKHANVAMLHAAKWMGIVQGSYQGGQGYDHFTAFTAPYLHGLSDRELDQYAQSFIFESNQIFAARGGQVPFTSMHCSPEVPKAIVDLPAVMGGKIVGVYGDYQDECQRFFDAICRVEMKGDRSGRLFAFPKHEIEFRREWLRTHEDSYRLVHQEAAKMGTPYFILYPDWMPSDASCQCLPYNEKIWIKTQKNEIKQIKIGSFIEEMKKAATGVYDGDPHPRSWFDNNGNHWINLKELKYDTLALNPCTQKIEFCPVTNLLIKKERSRIIKITTDSKRQAQTNEKHPFIVIEKNSIPKGLGTVLQLKIKMAEDLQIGDHIFEMDQSPNEYSENWKISTIANKEYLDFNDTFYDVEIGSLGINGNFVHSDGIITHNCCRIIFTKEGVKRFCKDKSKFDIFQSYMNIGSLQTVSINLPRLAYKANGDDALLYEGLDEQLRNARDILLIKKAITDHTYREDPLLNKTIPFPNGSEQPIFDMDRYSLTVGHVGLNEMLKAHLGVELHESAEAVTFGKKFMQYLMARLEEFSIENQYNFTAWEQPAESLKSEELILLYDKASNQYKLTEIGNAEINEDMMTIGFDKNNEPKKMQVSKLIKHPKRETMTIRCQHGDIYATKGHSLFTIDENLDIKTISSDDIQVGTSLLLPRKLNIAENFNPIDLSNCCAIVDEYIEDHGMRSLRYIEKTYDLGYILGQFIAEGSVSLKRHSVTLSCGINEERMKKVLSLANNIFRFQRTKVKPRRWKNTITKQRALRLQKKGFTIDQLRISHPEFFVEPSNFEEKSLFSFRQTKDMRGYSPMFSITGGSMFIFDIFSKGIELDPATFIQRSRQIPPFLYNAPIECVKGFLAGYIDGDGSINEYKRERTYSSREIYVRMTTVSRKLAFGVNFLLKRMGIIARFGKRKFDNSNWHEAYNLGITGKKDLNILREFIPRIPESSGFNNSNSHSSFNFKPILKQIDSELKRLYPNPDSPRYPTSLRMLAEQKLIPFMAAKCIQEKCSQNISENVLLEALESLQKLGKATPTSKKVYKFFSENSLTKVLSIEKNEGTDYVYDLAIPENENFIAGTGQIYAHNSTAERFAKLDLKQFNGKALVNGDPNAGVYYTNSNHVRYSSGTSLFNLIDIQSQFHPIVKGGVITHLWLGENHPDPDSLFKFTQRVQSSTPTAYMAYTLDFTDCHACHKFTSGRHSTCPSCGSVDLDYWSRVTGYYSRVSAFSNGKKSEWEQRVRHNL